MNRLLEHCTPSPVMALGSALCGLLLVATDLPAREWRVAVGPQLEYRASFPGSDRRETGIGGFVEVHAASESVRPETLDTARIGWFGDDTWETGLAFNIAPGRDAGDVIAEGWLGLSEVDTSFELGAFALTRIGFLELGVEWLHAVNGHKGWLLTPELAFESDASQRFRWRVGLSLSYASADYMDQFFSSSGARFGGIPQPNFSAQRSFRDVSLRLATAYDLSGPWTLVSSLAAGRYLGDAADSPIVRQGSRDDLGLAIGVAYSF